MLCAVKTLLRSLLALLPLTVVALWLVPIDRALSEATVHAVQVSTPTVALTASPTTLGAIGAEAEAEDDEREHPPITRRRSTRAEASNPATLDAATAARADGPIYTVLRSGQAHRSAP